ncbi:hypothetical protein [Streptomyces alfalfae]
MTTTTATHLRTIALHWHDLHDAAGQPVQHGAFGLGLRGYLARLDELDAEQQEHERQQAAHLRSLERDPIQLGERTVPVRLHILDTMRAVEAALIACADDIARQVQRPPMSMPRPQRAAVTRTRAERLAWRTGPGRSSRPRRTLSTHDGGTSMGSTPPRTPRPGFSPVSSRRPGPCRPLDEAQERRIGKVAAGAAERVERVLDIAAQRRTLQQRCACGGAIDVHGGEGRAPLAHCTGCGRVWSEGGVITHDPHKVMDRRPSQPPGDPAAPNYPCVTLL